MTTTCRLPPIDQSLRTSPYNFAILHPCNTINNYEKNAIAVKLSKKCN